VGCKENQQMTKIPCKTQRDSGSGPGLEGSQGCAGKEGGGCYHNLPATVGFVNYLWLLCVHGHVGKYIYFNDD
jgi:hypothetical protein